MDDHLLNGFEPLASPRSRASYAHKTNHSFMPNAEFVSFEHPRFGLVPCILVNHDVKAGEEIFVHYGYDLQGTRSPSGLGRKGS